MTKKGMVGGHTWVFVGGAEDGSQASCMLGKCSAEPSPHFLPFSFFWTVYCYVAQADLRCDPHASLFFFKLKFYWVRVLLAFSTGVVGGGGLSSSLLLGGMEVKKVGEGCSSKGFGGTTDVG
jgi:hypothetical protein